MAARTPGTKTPYPGFIEPALATSITKVPSGPVFDLGYQLWLDPGTAMRALPARTDIVSQNGHVGKVPTASFVLGGSHSANVVVAA
jgi:hypothetical protein